MPEENIKKYCPDYKKKKLKDFYKTRWVERIHGMDILQNLFVAIVNTFEDTSINNERKCNRDTFSRGI